MTIVGGFIWMALLGSEFLLGNIGPYIVSYYPDATSTDT